MLQCVDIHGKGLAVELMSSPWLSVVINVGEKVVLDFMIFVA
jgi:hypothetical protein